MIDFLQLLQLSDSAIPIGNTAHSFGLEMLTSLQLVDSDNLEQFLRDYLEETGLQDAVHCRAAWSAGPNELVSLNAQISALRTSRELRQASLVLGRRLLRLVHDCEPRAEFDIALKQDEMHYAIAFGFITGVLRIDTECAVSSMLNQSVVALTSAAQRLLPVGQSQASRILWRLKPLIGQVAQKSSSIILTGTNAFTPILDVASMRHRSLHTRLFIS